MISTLETALDGILEQPLELARAHGSATGYVGFDLPLDVLLSSNRHCCHLPWQAGRSTPQADQWLETAFPGWARSILQDWIEGQFDCFDRVIFTRGDDAIQRLYYYICELQRQKQIAGPRPLIFDVTTIVRDSSRSHCRLAVQKLLQQLEIAEDALPAGIAAANRMRSVYGNWHRLRPVAGRIHDKLARALLFHDCTTLLDNSHSPEKPPVQGVLLVGSDPPDESLHLAVEAAGWDVTGEVYQRTLGRFGRQLDPDDGIAAVADLCHSQQNGPRSFTSLVARVKQAMVDSDPAAIVLWLAEEDEALAWQVPGLDRLFKTSGLPALKLVRRDWHGRDDSSAQITDFLRGLLP